MNISTDVSMHNLRRWGVRIHRERVAGITYLEKVWWRMGNAEEGRADFSVWGTIEFSNVAYMSFPFY